MKYFTKEEYRLVAQNLLEGKVALLPTDTVYGLATIPTSKEGVQKIYDLKVRKKSFNLPIMVSKTSQLRDLGLKLKSHTLSLLDSPYIPGAVSLILGFENDERINWLERREEVAVRLPNHEFLLSVLNETGPLLVTSANKHQSPNQVSNIPEILNELEGKPDIIVDEGNLSYIPSTIVNCRHNEVTVEREGQINSEELKKYYSI